EDRTDPEKARSLQEPYQAKRCDKCTDEHPGDVSLVHGRPNRVHDARKTTFAPRGSTDCAWHGFGHPRCRGVPRRSARCPLEAAKPRTATGRRRWCRAVSFERCPKGNDGHVTCKPLPIVTFVRIDQG